MLQPSRDRCWLKLNVNRRDRLNISVMRIENAVHEQHGKRQMSSYPRKPRFFCRTPGRFQATTPQWMRITSYHPQSERHRPGFTQCHFTPRAISWPFGVVSFVSVCWLFNVFLLLPARSTQSFPVPNPHGGTCLETLDSSLAALLASIRLAHLRNATSQSSLPL